MITMVSLYVSQGALWFSRMTGVAELLFIFGGFVLLILLLISLRWRVIIAINLILILIWAKLLFLRDVAIFGLNRSHFPSTETVSLFFAGLAVQGILVALRWLVDVTRVREDHLRDIQSFELADVKEENGNLRDHLSRIERVSVVEAMTTALAHEVSQPLSAALASSQAATRWLNRSQPDVAEAARAATAAAAQLDRVRQTFETIHRLTARMPTDPRGVDLGQLLDDLRGLVQADLAGSGLSATISLADGGPWFVLAREEDLGQAMLNLVRNSAEAFAQSGMTGEICLFVAAEGDDLLLGVRDQAGGFAKALDAIQTVPMATTKEHGSGLGLALCREIAARYHGLLQILDAPPHGACVQLRLPRLDDRRGVAPRRASG